jgi:hypothetical protein
MYNRMSSPQMIYALREVGSQELGTTNRELGRSRPEKGQHRHLSRSLNRSLTEP